MNLNLKRSILALMTAAMLATTALSVPVFAEETTGTSNSEAEIMQINDASGMPDAVGGVITLTSDVTLTSVYKTSESVTIDLGGHTLTAANFNTKDEKSAISAFAGSVKIENGTVNGRVNCYDASTLTIASGCTVNGMLAVWGDPGKTPTLNFYGEVSNSAQAISTNGTDYSKPVINIYSGAEVTSTGDTAMYIPNCGSVNIYGGTITGVDSAIGIKCGTLNISGGTLTATGADSTPTIGWSNGINASGAAIQIESNDSYKADASTPGTVKVNITGGTITSQNGNAIYEYLAVKDGSPLATDTHLSSLSISGSSTVLNSGSGKPVLKISEELGKKSGVIQISGGTYSSNPTAYLVPGKIANKNDGTWTVGDVQVPDSAPETDTAPPAANVTAPEVSQDKQAAVTAAVSAITSDVATVTGNMETKETVTSVAESAVTSSETKTAATQGVTELNKLNNVLVESADEVKVVVQPQIDIAVKDVTTENETVSVTLDISASVNLIATTKSVEVDDIVTSADGGQPQNAVVVDNKPVTVDTPIPLSVPLGSVNEKFKNATVYIEHKHGSNTYYYETTTDDDGVANFVSVYGLSDFGFSTKLSENVTASTAVTVGGTQHTVYYTSLQQAVDAVPDGGTITLQQDNQSAIVSGNKTFTVNANGHTYTLTAASGYVLTDNGNGRYTVAPIVNVPVYVPTVPDITTPDTTTSVKSGWDEIGSNTVYYKSGRKVTGFSEISGETYYFDRKGYLQKGWLELDEGWYYLDPADGAMVTGWKKLKNTWYYLDPKTGLMAEGGLREIDGVTYYFYDWGGMASAWWYEAKPGDWYYFRGNGAMAKNAWIEWKSEYYYVGADGKMLTSTTTPDGYKVDANGVWVR